MIIVANSRIFCEENLEYNQCPYQVPKIYAEISEKILRACYENFFQFLIHCDPDNLLLLLYEMYINIYIKYVLFNPNTHVHPNQQY